MLNLSVLVVMASLTQVPWSKGRYDSYTLRSDGSLVGTIHHPGFAWLATENNINHPSDMTFLSSRNQLCRGSRFIAALLPTKFKSMKTEIVFPCHLVLVMGAKVTSKLLLVKCVYLHLGRECLSYPRFRRKCFILQDYVCIEMCVLNSGFLVRRFKFQI